MSAPETTSKGRPSLLSETAPGAPDSSSRILASLEGRVSAQPVARRRRSNKKPLAAAALAIVAGAGALGAWQWQRTQPSGHAPVAAATVAHAAARTGKPEGPAVASGVASAAVQAAASTPQAAVIVADDTPASASSAVGADPLSRALASGVAASPASAPPVQAEKAPAKSAASSAAPAHSTRDNTKNRHDKQQASHAAVVKRPKAHGSTEREDPDVDLLAALVARTKPYDAHAASDSVGAKAAAAKAHPVSLAAQVKQCDKSNFFEAQVCRWRVCSDHWGKDPACPSANSNANAQAR
ncbi:phage tail protein [Trinickia diaoshuihuensis]|uniref:phage tail protein n=1 Tax=Trinickia diaoshuihuensis TaxID=2292265 RepID=UPI000E24BD5B|nr:phage tail protein [Trinickia diaoshuihuensis]